MLLTCSKFQYLVEVFQTSIETLRVPLGLMFQRDSRSCADPGTLTRGHVGL